MGGFEVLLPGQGVAAVGGVHHDQVGSGHTGEFSDGQVGAETAVQALVADSAGCVVAHDRDGDLLGDGAEGAVAYGGKAQHHGFGSGFQDGV